MGLDHVLWIGGAQGSGKSSIAKALSRRFDLQLYAVDRRVQAHWPRIPPSEFMSLSMEERWVNATPDRMLEWFAETSRDWFPLVLADLEALPPSPTIVAEGPQLFPAFVAPVLGARDQAVFLLVDREAQRERLLARPGILGTSDPRRARENATKRDLMIAERIDREARELGLAAFEVDRPLPEMIELVVSFFADAVARGPRAVDLAAIRRTENEALATQVRLYRESLGFLKPEDATLPFACECGETGCADELELPLEEYEAVTAAGGTLRSRPPKP